jgi:hypothetical protein
MGPGLLLLFIIGDILGTGVYALIGDVAAEVGGAAWVPFLFAFVIAAITALSYLELVTKYPQAAGAALYAQKAFNQPFITFVVAFIVMCAGITSASTASRFFAANFFIAFQFSWGTVGLLVVALVFIAVLGVVNLRGVGGSIKLNVVLSCIEAIGLLLVIGVGMWAFVGGQHADYSRIVSFHTAGDKSIFLAITAATSLAFFAMVGFEDSVNMAEETKDPVKTFPQGPAVRLDHRRRRLHGHRGHHGGSGPGRSSENQRHSVGGSGPGRGAGPADQRHPAVHFDGRCVQHRADQHADGQSADLRDGPPAGAAARARHRQPQPACAVGSHRLHYRDRVRGHPLRHVVRR